MSRNRDSRPDSRADTIPHVRPTGGQDRRSGTEYAADLARETDASLRSATLWPYTGPRRYRPPPLAELGGGTASRTRKRSAR